MRIGKTRNKIAAILRSVLISLAALTLVGVPSEAKTNTSSCPPEPYASGLLTVTCVQKDSTGQSCVHWTFTPNMTASSTNAPTVANLFYYTKTGRQQLVLVGQYYLTVRFDVSYP